MKETLVNLLLVGAGGFIGAVLRYGVSGMVQVRAGSTSFPYGTLSVNLLGCLLIGAIAGLVESRQVFSPEFRSFALVGLLGAFTTYSTFGYETFALLREAEYGSALLSTGLQVIAGLLMVWFGYSLAVRWS